MDKTFKFGSRVVGGDNPTFFIAEMSCNHNQDFNTAVKIIEEAAKAGADAIKLQAYKPDTVTLDCDNDMFQIKDTLWKGQTIHDLYKKAYTPWEWHYKLKKLVDDLGMEMLTTPFDTTAVDYLEPLDLPCYKIASTEIVDHPLLKRIAQTGKPVIISSGMATLGELDEAIRILRKGGCNDICMLKCTSAYPATPEEANLVTIPHMANTFNVIPGLSDHTLNVEVPMTAVTLGAKVVEKHFTLSRQSGSPDDAFSLLPHEFKQMVDSVRVAEKCMGKVTYGGVKGEEKIKKFRKSIFASGDIKKGDVFTEKNIKCVRPAYGLHTKYYEDILGKVARKDVEFGQPIEWSSID